MPADTRSDTVRSWDLSAIILLSLLLAAFIFLVPDNPGRIIIGLPFILFFPGYGLISTLFPEKGSLDLIERIALSFGVSIAIVPLIGFGLNYTPFGIRLEPILASLIIFNITFCVAGMWRRTASKDPYLPFDPRTTYTSAMGRFNSEGKVDKVLTVVLVIAILSSVIALIYVVAFPKQGESFTEFYILGPGGKASGYPQNITTNQSAPVIIGIANHEHRTVNYTVEVWLSNITYADNSTFVNHLYYVGSFYKTLDHVDANIEGNWTKQWETSYNISVPITGQYKIWFVLLKDEQPYSGSTFVDVATTETAVRFIDLVQADDSYTLNLNLNVA
ncbi:MAG: DUF1616 domain-containing protein [Methanomassiliicoccus sp.]|nr:DUF1616 domain-containing protein [Methanomassiliicoccus sp.]